FLCEVRLSKTIYCFAKMYVSLHSDNKVRAGRNDVPFSVREYSTRGGTSGYALRVMMSSVSNSFSCFESTFNAIAGIVLLSSLKRIGPLSRSHIMGGFHFPPITSIVAVIGHS